MADLPEGVTVDRSGPVPARTDNRSVLKMLHDELTSHFALPKPTDRNVNDGGQKKGLMNAVDDAVNGAPAAGSEDY